MTFTDTIGILVDINDEIDQRDLDALQDSISNFAGSNYYDVSGTKAPFMFIVYQAGTIENDSIDIGVTFIMDKGAPVSTESYPYSSSWPYGFGEDIPCNVSQADEDAADLFRRDLRSALQYEPSSKTEKYYFIDPYVVCWSGGEDLCFSFEIPTLITDKEVQLSEIINPDDPTPDDNFYEYLLFRVTTADPNNHVCLDSDEMNFYYESMEELIDLESATIPVGSREISKIEVGYNVLALGNTIEFQSMQVIFAEKVNPVGSFPVQALPNP